MALLLLSLPPPCLLPLFCAFGQLGREVRCLHGGECENACPFLRMFMRRYTFVVLLAQC